MIKINRPFRINLVDNNRCKSIIMMYYKTLNSIPIFSCNDLGSYRIVNINNIGRVILIGSDILSRLDDRSIESLAWSLILQIETDVYRTDYNEVCYNYIDDMTSSLFEYSVVINTLEQLENIEREHNNIEQADKLYKRINYLENKTLRNNKIQCIDMKNILERANLASISEVE